MFILNYCVWLILHSENFLCRSCRWEVFCKKGVLRSFTKFTGKRLCQSLFFNKVTGLSPATLLKKRLWHRCFPVRFVKFLRTTFYIEHFWWLLLALITSLNLRANFAFVVFDGRGALLQIWTMPMKTLEQRQYTNCFSTTKIKTWNTPNCCHAPVTTITFFKRDIQEGAIDKESHLFIY